MDYEYDGVLNDLYCEMCTEKISDVHLAYEHTCFEDIPIDRLNIVGNVIRHSLSDEMTYEDDISVEYLDEYEELMKNTSTDNENPLTLPIHNLTPATSKKAKERTTVSPMSRLDAQTKKVIDFCMKDYGETSVPTSTKLCQAESSIDVDEVDHHADIELDENGIAYASEKNLITLIELVREKPCLWNYTLPIGQRNQYAVNIAWTDVAAKFQGWNPRIARREFSNLRSAFIRRNMMQRSGSAGRKRKPWVFEPYFSFIKDLLDPGITISNISPPKPKKPAAENIRNEKVENESSQLSDLGFQKNILHESPVPTKKSKPLDPVERILLQNITNKVSRESRPPLNQWQQWGMWLGKEIEDFPDATDRIEIQAYITQYIAKKKRELQASLR